MNTKKYLLALLLLGAANVQAEDRALWGSICGNKNATYIKEDLNKLLLTWRMLPGDDEETAFDLYMSYDNGTIETKVNDSSIKATNYVVPNYDNSRNISFRLTLAGTNVTVGEYTITSAQLTNKEPYISIPLKSTEDACKLSTIGYCANDCSVGDLDGDGQMEVVVKRILSILDENGGVISDGSGAGSTPKEVRHIVLWDAYKLDGTFMWRIKSGPSLLTGNSTSFAIADFDGDGRAEMAIKTGEGTVFGDGTEIGDTNGDGITDYRTSTGGWVDHYNSAGPEFLSVVDGATGRELARTDYIARETSESWGDGYWKRANSHRLGVASFSGEYPSIFVARGVYARSVLEGWDFRNGKLTRRFHFDTSNTKNNKNKDGKPNSAYASQGNHSFNAADLDGDGKDEIMFGSMVLDHDGNGLWTSGLGHGDANHVGKFIKDSKGLQVYHCLEGGVTNVAFHDGATGNIIWKNAGTEDSDCGRCLVADFTPDNPGMEFWWAGSGLYDNKGNQIGDKPKSCNAAIWFSGELNRQLINESTIDSYNTRVFTMYRYDMSFNNSTKSNPSWYGDILGDWREEIIVPDNTKLKDLKIFSTWMTTSHRFPWLMTDHTYLMSALNENVGYNQPTNLGYYLGSDLSSDSEVWPASTRPDSAKLVKHGVGSSNQTLKQGTTLEEFFYNWEGAASVEVSGLPNGIEVTINDNEKKVTFSGTADDEPGEYTYTIKTVGAKVDTEVIRTITILGESTGSVAENSERKIKIFPNPTAGDFFVTGITEGATVSVYNNFGQKVLQQTCEDDIHISTTLPSGCYVVEIQTAEQVVRQRLLVK